MLTPSQPRRRDERSGTTPPPGDPRAAPAHVGDDAAWSDWEAPDQLGRYRVTRDADGATLYCRRHNTGRWAWSLMPAVALVLLGVARWGSLVAALLVATLLGFVVFLLLLLAAQRRAQRGLILRPETVRLTPQAIVVGDRSPSLPTDQVQRVLVNRTITDDFEYYETLVWTGERLLDLGPRRDRRRALADAQWFQRFTHTTALGEPEETSLAASFGAAPLVISVLLWCIVVLPATAAVLWWGHPGWSAALAAPLVLFGGTALMAAGCAVTMRRAVRRHLARRFQ